MKGFLMAKAKTSIVKVNRERHMIITPVVRLSFPQLFVPKSFQDDPNKPKTFRCDLIAPSKDVWKEPYQGKKTQTVSLLKAITNCKVDQWGNNKSNWPSFTYPPIKNGNDRVTQEGKVYEGYEDSVFISPSTGENYPPKIVLANGKDATERDLYGGCYVRAQILCRPYQTPLMAGVSLRLLSVMKVKEGQKFGLDVDLFDIDEDDESDNWEGEDSDDEDDEF